MIPSTSLVYSAPPPAVAAEGAPQQQRSIWRTRRGNDHERIGGDDSSLEEDEMDGEEEDWAAVNANMEDAEEYELIKWRLYDLIYSYLTFRSAHIGDRIFHLLMER